MKSIETMARVNILIRLRAALLSRRWRGQTFVRRGFGWQAATALLSPTGSYVLARGKPKATPQDCTSKREAESPCCARIGPPAALSHDPRAASHGTRILHLNKGALANEGQSDEVPAATAPM